MAVIGDGAHRDRRIVLEARLVATDRLHSFLSDRLSRIEPVLAELRQERRRQSEATREVTNLLDGLRSGGRSVGVVSHVPELRVRIPDQVRVTKSETGSTVAVVRGLAQSA